MPCTRALILLPPRKSTLFDFMKSIPALLTILRLILGPIILIGAYRETSSSVLVVLLIVGVLSDIFDGIIARKLGVSTPQLRQFDSGTDVVFWLCVIVAAFIVNEGLLDRYKVLISLVLVTELLCNSLSYFKFQKMPATHTYLAKSWGLCLLLNFSLLLIKNEVPSLVVFTLCLGLLVNCEVIAIILSSRNHPVDIPSLFSRKAYRKAREDKVPSFSEPS